MYISQINIKNYRNFKSVPINFQEGINVIIGHNNSGKTNLLRALDLVVGDVFSKKLSIEDFHRPFDTTTYFKTDAGGELIEKQPPSIMVSIIIKQSEGDGEKAPIDSNTVYHWKIKVTRPYEAKLTYKFFLPDGEDSRKYEEEVKNLITQGKTSEYDYWQLMKKEFVRKYIYRIYGGDETSENLADRQHINRFGFQFVNAIRDVERELFSGQNTLLKDVLSFFLDHKLRKDPRKTTAEKIQEKDATTQEFYTKSSELLTHLKGRIDSEPMLEYATNIGASLGGDEPTFEGGISEVNLFSALRLMIKKQAGFDIPATHNGLGYNNLIYISILLSKMQMSMEDYTSIDDQKVFPMLAIEEPEAHLHPAMQFKLLKFLKENLKGTNKKVRQIFVTSHSTHITSSVDLEEIICLNIDENNVLQVAYPGKVFSDNDDDKKSKAYVKRFLDATKSDMLFAKRVILVEGLAEQMLMDVFVKYVKGKDKSLADYHIAVVGVGGRYFDHFLRLFHYENNSSSLKRFALNKNIAAAIDSDPSKKVGSYPKSCYPFEEVTTINELKEVSTIAANTNRIFHGNNIKIGLDQSGKGKTLEYAMIIENPTCNQLVTSFMSNRSQLNTMMDSYSNNETLANILGHLPASSKIKPLLESCTKTGWIEEDKKKAAIASRYLQSVKSKGEHALAVYQILLNNLEKNPGDQGHFEFKVPDYIKEVIQHVCK